MVTKISVNLFYSVCQSILFKTKNMQNGTCCTKIKNKSKTCNIVVTLLYCECFFFFKVYLFSFILKMSHCKWKSKLSMLHHGIRHSFTCFQVIKQSNTGWREWTWRRQYALIEESYLTAAGTLWNTTCLVKEDISVGSLTTVRLD